MGTAWYKRNKGKSYRLQTQQLMLSRTLTEAKMLLFTVSSSLYVA